jgi:hypothetical protein
VARITAAEPSQLVAVEKPCGAAPYSLLMLSAVSLWSRARHARVPGVPASHRDAPRRETRDEGGAHWSRPAVQGSPLGDVRSCAGCEGTAARNWQGDFRPDHKLAEWIVGPASATSSSTCACGDEALARPITAAALSYRDTRPIASSSSTWRTATAVVQGTRKSWPCPATGTAAEPFHWSPRETERPWRLLPTGAV